VIRDIIHRIKDRFPLHVLVWPVRVQGETTAREVTAAVNGFNALTFDGAIRQPDVLIVARGGGSLEDLWGFNDEGLARAVAASGIPVISAVGHETDWTLIDFVADMRAPTPTGAAEIAVPVRADLEATLASLGARLRAAISRKLERKSQAVRAAARALPSPDQLLALPRRRFDDATSRLGRGLTVNIERKRAALQGQRLTPATLSRRLNEARTLTGRDIARARAAFFAIVRERRARFKRTAARLSPAPIVRRQKQQTDTLMGLSRRQDQAVARRLDRLRAALTQADRLLSTLSHKAVLARGFALVKDADGAVIKRVAELAPGAALQLEFADGAAEAIATSGGARPKLATKPVSKAKEPGNQGSLF